MQIQKIQAGNSYNTNFCSKIEGVYTGRYGDDCYWGLRATLYDGLLDTDRTYLEAIKGLLNDGRDDQYTYVRDKGSVDSVGTFKIYDADSSKTSDYVVKHGSADELFRDIIVDIARQKGILPGKSIGIEKIMEVYNREGVLYNRLCSSGKSLEESVYNSRRILGKEGFSVNNPADHLSDEEKKLVKKDLEDLERLMQHPRINKKRIESLKSKIAEKLEDHCKSEFWDLINESKENMTANAITKRCYIA